MRSKKELIQLVLKSTGLFQSGLCMWLHVIFSFHGMSKEEYCFLSELLEEDQRYDPLSFFLGKEGDIKPRIKWLEEHLNKEEL